MTPVIHRGFGAVYLALDRTTGKDVAIKKVELHPNDEANKKEAELQQKCESHYVVKYYDAFVVGNELWVLRCFDD